MPRRPFRADFGTSDAPAPSPANTPAEDLELFRERSAPHGTPDGLDRFRAERQEAQRELGYRLGLPLGLEVECTLRDSTVLRGVLRLDETEWITHPGRKDEDVVFRIGRTTFTSPKIRSCVATGG